MPDQRRGSGRDSGQEEQFDLKPWGLRKRWSPGKTPFWFEWADNLKLLRKGKKSVSSLL